MMKYKIKRIMKLKDACMKNCILPYRHLNSCQSVRQAISLLKNITKQDLPLTKPYE